MSDESCKRCEANKHYLLREMKASRAATLAARWARAYIDFVAGVPHDEDGGYQISEDFTIETILKRFYQDAQAVLNEGKQHDEGSRNVEEMRAAREKITRAFRDDPDFRRGYVDNVACILLDNDVADDGTKRNLVADQIVKRIFEE
ncbi:MAG: hypothetical protein Q8K86_00230 [Candidatus Nanopelagicaceae bacterium]|nr:hypothetical protein [Candidatus Nanopelagicaceae bacterium]